MGVLGQRRWGRETMFKKPRWDQKADERGGFRNLTPPKEKRTSYDPNDAYASSANRGETVDEVADAPADSLDSLVDEERSRNDSVTGRFRHALGKIPGKAVASRAVNYAIRKAAQINIPGIPASTVALTFTATLVSLIACENADPIGKLSGNGNYGRGERVIYSRPSTPQSTATKSKTEDLSEYSSMLVEAFSNYPKEFDFVSNGLDPIEKRFLEIIDVNILKNKNFLDSKYSPDNWPSEIRLASIQTLYPLSRKIEIIKRPGGNHEISWPDGSLDNILAGFGIYGNADRISDDDETVVSESAYDHGDFLKRLAYLLIADSKGITLKEFGEYNADDFENLLNPANTRLGFRYALTYQGERGDGTTISFPEIVYKAIGDTTIQKEAAERLLKYPIPDDNVHRFGADEYDFAKLLRKRVRTPADYTRFMTSAFQSVGLPAGEIINSEGQPVGWVKVGEEERLYYDSCHLWLLSANLSAPHFSGPSPESVVNPAYDLNCER